ncbi:UNVERIFIED_CONTAM: hypothetical protein Slati_0813000 [Sesamum latifolium]|uniref:Uncharacterized protein n=1 Tax=Sesamum latifolium TaxID=2727402 RepID=A0AAW2XKV6_9LAMI
MDRTSFPKIHLLTQHENKTTAPNNRETRIFHSQPGSTMLLVVPMEPDAPLNSPHDCPLENL